MSENRTNLEIIAPTIEEAIQKGLADLNLAEEQVDVEILDQGSRGLFGLGSRMARIRLTIRGSGQQAPIGVESLPEAEAEASATAEEVEMSAEELSPADLPAPTGEGEEEIEDDTLEVSRVVVKELLVKMRVRAQVTARYYEPEDERSKETVWVDVRGSDLSILIGPKAETLNALQSIAGLIIAKELGHTIPLVVDVEGFRARRTQQLRQLARRMADQAVKTGRRQMLEPMPASERRIIHIELRNNPAVKTESIGEEPRRKVTIVPK